MPQMNISTIDSPEFINLQSLDINPLMSKCEIKVLYVGQNRNHSYITKEVATEMSKTLRGAPIVGWYKETKEDFSDHGDVITVDGDGIHFNCMTKPYGFVSPDAQVWFQKFKESDDFGNEVTREYLMTTGFLWTGQFEECQDVVECGRPHSMELDEKSLKGKWSTDINSNMDFFIINDAIFSKLCILGNDVEPCFEGSNITAPNISGSFTKIDNNFKKTLFSMMKDLEFALQKGGTSMSKEVNGTSVVNDPAEVTGIAPENTLDNTNFTANNEQEKFSATQDKVEQNTTEKNQKFTEEVKNQNDNTSFVSSEKKKDKEEDKKEDSTKETNDTNDDNSNEDEEDKKKKAAVAKNSLDAETAKKYDELEQQYNELNNKYTQLQNDYQSLVDFKNQIENEKKDALIASFYMLSEEDKKDVLDNKEKYSLDTIEAKLSIIYTKKQFDLEKSNTAQSNNIAKNVVTFNLNNKEINENVPDWVKAVREVEKTNS